MNLGFVVTQHSKERIEFAGRAGFDSLEIFTEKNAPLDIEKMSEKDISEFMEFMKNNNVKLGTLTCSVNHLDGDKARRKENNEYFIKTLKICKKLGTDIVATNAWADKTKSPSENMKDYKEVFSEYAKVAEAEGVKIAIENCPHSVGYPIPIGNIAYSPEMWEAMFEAVPSKAVGLEFDPSHLLWLGVDYVKAIRDFGDRIYAFHAKDTEIMKDMLAKCGIYGRQFGASSEWDLGWWRYRIPGWGMVDWKGVFKALNDIGFEGQMAIEHEDPVFGGERTDEGLKLGLRYLRQFML